MKITRKQSIGIALGILVLFFGLSFALMDTGSQASIPELPENAEALRSDRQAAGELSSAIQAGELGPAVTLNRFHRSESKDGRKLWEITAVSGQYLPEQHSALVQEATLLFFQKDGKVIQLEADQAKLKVEDANLNQAEIEGSVRITYNDEISLATDQALYDRVNNLVTAPGLVTIDSDMIEITGKEMRADLDKQEFVLQRSVNSVIKPRSP